MTPEEQSSLIELQDERDKLRAELEQARAELDKATADVRALERVNNELFIRATAKPAAVPEPEPEEKIFSTDEFLTSLGIKK